VKVISNKIYNDIGLNILASIFLTIATQIIALPILSRMVNIHEYGEILTMFAIMSILAVPFGGTLSDTRLLTKINKLDFKVESTYNYLLMILLIINFIFLNVIYINFFKVNLFHSFLMSLASSFLLLRAFYIVEYRVTLNYKRVLIVSILSIVGYTMGIIINLFVNFWSIIFFVGELVPVLFIIAKSQILKFGFKKSELLKSTIGSFIFLVIASLLNFIIMYSDRFLLLPVLGSKYVSIFLVSSFLGKTIGVVLGPISSVLFSYYVKEDSISITTIYKRLAIYFIVSFVSFIGIIILGKPILLFLYPTIYPHIHNIYILSNLGAILYIVGNLLQPTMMSNTKPRINTIVQLLYFIFYLTIAYTLVTKYSLIGFCIGIVISNLLRIVLITTVTHIAIKKYQIEG